MASFVYNIAKKEILDGTLDLDSDSGVKVMLVTSGYSANPDDTVIGSGVGTPGGEEFSGTGYTGGFGGAGRKVLGARVVNQDDTNDRAEFDDTADITWSSIDGDTASAAIIVKEVSTDSDSRLIAYIDTGGFPITANGGDITLQWNAEGIIQI